MKLAMYKGRSVIIEIENGKIFGYDIASECGGKFGDVFSIINDWNEFMKFMPAAMEMKRKTEIDPHLLDTPIPFPKQIFAVGLNYKSHQAEMGYASANDDFKTPDIFTKFASSLAPAYCKVKLPNDTVDWEVELVAVIGKAGRNIPKAKAWEYVRGLTIGQDISDRTLQHSGGANQFSLGKSHENFSPVGPWITTLDEISNPDDLAISCTVNGEERQFARTSAMIMGVPTLIEKISAVVEVYPGDLLFTGTPGGVGNGRNPKVFLKSGEKLVSTIEGLGEMEQFFYS